MTGSFDGDDGDDGEGGTLPRWGSGAVDGPDPARMREGSRTVARGLDLFPEEVGVSGLPSRALPDLFHLFPP